MLGCQPMGMGFGVSRASYERGRVFGREGAVNKKACEGAPTVNDGDMEYCQSCEKGVAWDLVDSAFFGFNKENCKENRNESIS